MNRDRILNEIYANGLVNKIANSMASKLGKYKDDFIQHIYLVLSELPDDKLIGMYERKELEYYTFYIAKAQTFNNNSDFWRQHKGRIDLVYDEDYDTLKVDNNED